MDIYNYSINIYDKNNKFCLLVSVPNNYMVYITNVKYVKSNRHVITWSEGLEFLRNFQWVEGKYARKQGDMVWNGPYVYNTQRLTLS